ncbi:MAG TPA: IPT/TIG domain-containing protein [Acidobacteriaceae bacterium]|nr:IPT/TIG domain-containing protein [Acidobacteriaceae bacterium]
MLVSRLRCLALTLSFASLLTLSGCGGGGGSSAGTQPPPTQNPTPSVTSVTPATVVAGSASQTLTVTGTGFLSSSVVNFNGAALATSYVSATSLTAALPASAIAADGSAKVTVTNPSPGGGVSGAFAFAITVPTPAVASLSPQTVPQGAAATITLTGTGFEANSVVQWNGSPRPTTFVNPTTLQVVLTAADVANFGAGQISVTNPNTPPSTPLDLYVYANTPTITGIYPNSIQPYTGTLPYTLSINGSGFAPNATVLANGVLVPIAGQSSTSIVCALPPSMVASAGNVLIVVSNPGSPVISSNTATLTVVAATAPSFTVSPNYAPAGSPDTTITLFGSGFHQDSVVNWNGTALTTTYVSATQVKAVIPAADIAGFVHATISVDTPENTTPAPPQTFDTYLALPTNDIVYNSVDGLIYASVPGTAGSGLGNTIAAVDPVTGVIRKTIYVGSEPNRLALSTDGTQLFVVLNGALAIRQVNLTTATAGGQFSLPAGPFYSNPLTVQSLAAVPGQPNSVAIATSDGVIRIYDSGVVRANTSSVAGFPYVTTIAFGGSATTLYAAASYYSPSNLYQLTVDSTGITASKQIGSGAGGSTMQYDNGYLYFPLGIVFNASTGTIAGQFSIPNGSASPSAAQGPIVSDSSLHRAWVLLNNYNNNGQLAAYDENTYNPLGTVTLNGVNSIYNGIYGNPADLIRWGQNGLAFHTTNQLYVLQTPIVKDNTGSPADVSVSVQAPASATTGASMNWIVTVSNLGPNQAQGVTVQGMLPGSVIFGSMNASQGYCSGTGDFYCDLANIASGSSATVTISVTPMDATTLQLTASVESVSYDPVSSNNQSTANTTTTGAAYNAPPQVTQLAPSVIQAGSGSFILAVDGDGFTAGSSVLWNGQALPTTFLSSGQLTASVDSSKIAGLGWASISVSTPAPGGGTSAPLPFTVYQVVNLPANAIAYEPFTRKLYATLPSTSTTIAGNSVVTIDPQTGTTGTPINVGSEPNLLAESSDGNYMFVGLSGAKAIGRLNLLTQSLDLTVPLPATSTYNAPTAASGLATIPGTNSTLAVQASNYGSGGMGILDISGSTATFRAKFGYGSFPVFSDATHFYSSDGSTLYRYSVDANGPEQIDATTLNGLGGYNAKFVLDGGLIFGGSGGIANPSTTPPSQIAMLPLGMGSYGNSLTGVGVVPYAAASKSFNGALNNAGTNTAYLERFDTQHATLEDLIALPANSGIAGGTRWGQDGLAMILSSSSYYTPPPNQILLIQGPFVLPSEVASNAAPSLTAPAALTHGGGNTMLTVSGSGFLPGATVFWNGSARTTNYTDSGHLQVAIPASDLQSAGSITLTAQNPGSAASGGVTLTVQ